jgi:hypothetical protein
MTEALMPDSRDALLDRHLAGELSRAEQRALAQTALDDPELFDLLVIVGAMKTAVLEGGSLEAPAVASTDGEVMRYRRAAGHRTLPRRLSQRLTVGVGLAAAVVLTFMMVPRRPEPATGGAPADGRSPIAAIGAASRPRLLASRLGEPAEPRSRGPVSALTPEASRAPQQQGSILALTGGIASVDLGSLDGLANGMELTVVRGTETPVPVGRLIVTSTALERARGRVLSNGALRVGDQVQTSSSVYLSVLAAQVQTRIADDDLTTARTLAERAVAVVESGDVAADSRRAALVQLGAVEYRLRALAEGERHYRLAQAALDTVPAASAAERARISNELGAVLIAEGDYTEAFDVLSVAQSAAAGSAAVAAQVTNNLAALAVLRGDATKAASLYAAALSLVESSPTPSEADRSVIEKNLASLAGPDKK